MFSRFGSSFKHAFVQQPKRCKATAAFMTAGAVTLVTTVSIISIVTCQTKDVKESKIVVVGGGTAGIGVTAMLLNQGHRYVTLIEPKSVHFYQPLWSLVGAGIKPNTASVKDMKKVVPKGATWVQKEVHSFRPEQNQVVLNDGTAVDYDCLVVAAGIQIDWDKIPGLREGLEQEGSGVVSNYDFLYAAKTWSEFQRLVKEKLQSNTTDRLSLLFTLPTTPIKCAGAPQKIMWLLEDTLREFRLRERADISFWVPGQAMFGVKFYSDKLDAIRKARNVEVDYGFNLVSLNVPQKQATFQATTGKGESKTVPYDLIHVGPPMSAPDFIKTSPLADAGGWLDVDKHTLQSTKYANVFGLGDCTNTPNSKTAAAVISQAPVVVHNIEKHLQQKPLDGKYNGYASCPLIIGKKHVIMAEFGYDGKIMETFNRETGKFPWKYIGTEGDLQQRFFYLLKEQFFPYVYWNLWTRGWWYGADGILKPNVVEKTETIKAKGKVPK
jgi:sulfide:quinone oxidoreductase